LKLNTTPGLSRCHGLVVEEVEYGKSDGQFIPNVTRGRNQFFRDAGGCSVVSPFTRKYDRLKIFIRIFFSRIDDVILFGCNRKNDTNVSLTFHLFCYIFTKRLFPIQNTMKRLFFLLVLAGLFLIIPGCKKTESPEPDPVVKDPYAMFKYSKKADGIVSFTNTSTDATTYLWNFGDGETSTTAAVTFEHQYLKNGDYHATLTAYGNGKSAGAYADLNITTADEETVADVDGNVYHTVKIGTQVWMVENLKTTKYNDGSSISLVTDNSAWGNLLTPGYCWYNNDEATYKTPYGALYNWYAVNTGELAPQGWHIPTDAEWSVLITFLGGENIAGGKMKSTGTIGAGTGLWHNPNMGATNESGFTAVPAGYRNDLGNFALIGYYGYWWNCSTDGTNLARYRYIIYDGPAAESGHNYYILGYSVRCIKD
jgi:uncharacterized protein (TIGR02145 family)